VRLLAGVAILALYLAAAGAALRPRDEARVLAVARSVAQDGKLAVSPERPQALGLPLLAAPAYAVGGRRAVRALLAALAAGAFAAAAWLASAVVPAPWAWRGALPAAASAPAVLSATAIDPDLTAGGLLAVACALALRVREDPRGADGLVAAAALGALPWLAPRLLIPAIPVLLALVHWTSRHGRSVLALLEAELVAGSLVILGSVDAGLFGTPVPHEPVAPVALPAVAVLGAVPMAALAVAGTWLLWRSRREQLARALPGRRDAEAAAILSGLALGGVLIAAVLSERSLVAALPLTAPPAAWAGRRFPRAGAAALAATLAATAVALA
jgi:hypothetical protein